MITLNKEQIERLYKVFDFEEHEEIVRATMECENGGLLKIEYIDNSDNTIGCYEPYLARHSTEDIEKAKFIIEG